MPTQNGTCCIPKTQQRSTYLLEGRLEHASPDVDANEVREAVERFRQALPGLIESARIWLDRHGIELR